MKNKIALAYSGGLDTSVILKWLQEERGFDVYTFTANIGQFENLSEIAAKALKHGAKEARVLDLTEEFVGEYVFPMLRASPAYEGSYLLGTSISRPLIAKRLVACAHEMGCGAIAHGATGKGNDQIRFELTAYSLSPSIHIVAPWREWNFRGRKDLESYASTHGIEVPTTVKDPWSYDGNIFHASYEGGLLEDPNTEPPESLFRLTKDPYLAPDKAEYFEIQFEKGEPIALNKETMAPAILLQALNTIAGLHGIGRLDMVENRVTGIRSRGVYETPGGTLLVLARRAVESLTLDHAVIEQRDALAPGYSNLVYSGLWFSPERIALQAYFDFVSHHVTGTARLKLYKGNASIVGRSSPQSLYSQSLATFEHGQTFSQKDAEGFIRLSSTRLRQRAILSGGQSL